MSREIGLSEVEGLVGQEIGVSQWIEVTKPMLSLFSSAVRFPGTADREEPNILPAQTYAFQAASHFLPLSLLSTMSANGIPHIREQTMAVNYGFDRIRFSRPVQAGHRIRGRFKLMEARFRGAGLLMNRYEIAVEIENEADPALKAEWITISRFETRDDDRKLNE